MSVSSAVGQGGGAPADRGSFAHALTRRVLVADGAMGTMLQQAATTGVAGLKPLQANDFQGHEGCNEILNLTRAEVIAAIHAQYLQAGADCVETNTFGANFTALHDYGLADQVCALARAGAQIARAAADAASTPARPRYVLGSMGPGTKLPSLGQVEFATLRDAYLQQSLGLLEGGVDALLIETSQDLLQAKAAIIGARRAFTQAHTQVPILVSVTMETTGTMLLGAEIAAVLAVLNPLGVEGIGLNCATGPQAMSEHLRQLCAGTPAALSCMPNAGLPVLGPDGASYPLQPQPFAEAVAGFVTQFGLRLVGGCCGTTPEHIAALAAAVQQLPAPQHQANPQPAVASLYTAQPLTRVAGAQAATYLSIGERTNANGSKAFRTALLEGDLERCVDIARAQTRDGSHLLDVCVDYVGRDGVADMAALVGQLATASTLPLVLDSTEPEVLQAGLERLGGRALLNSVNFEDGEGPGSRFARTMALAREHGSAVVALTIDETGQARTSEHKIAVAQRLISTLTQQWGLAQGDILVDCLTFPITTGQQETRRDGLATLEAISTLRAQHPQLGLVLGVSNVSFGLNPPARQVLNSVFLHEAVQAGLSAAIVNPATIVPLARLQPEQIEVALDLIYDRRRPGYDPLARFMQLFADVDTTALAARRDQALASLPVQQRLRQRIIEGNRQGLVEDLEQALAAGFPALTLINEHLLDGMREVGRLFGSGQMQLPFVLQSAEVMKAAVAHLEPHLDRVDGAANQGRLLLATVRGDVHDIGKNLVDIIVSNNGFQVVNLGIKQPAAAIIDAAIAHEVDVIGMSGLLVKSTQVMRDNLDELAARGLADRWPILLGGAALTRPYVEQDLADRFPGVVRYAKDAFEGLRLLPLLVDVARGVPGAREALPPLRRRRVAPVKSILEREAPDVEAADVETPTAGAPSDAGLASLPAPRRSVEPAATLPAPPWWGTQVVRGVPLEEITAYLDQRSLFQGQWGLRATREVSYEQLVAAQGQPRLRHWLEDLHTQSLLETGVVYGFFPCASDGDDLLIFPVDAVSRQPQLAAEPVARWRFPRQARDAHLCLTDYWQPLSTAQASGQPDVLALQLVTMGARLSTACAELFATDRYRDYLELHGLSVQLTEALAERWHARVRAELGIAEHDAPDLAGVLRQQYQGARYSFGYPACPELGMRADVVRLLDAARIGVELSAELQLHPEQSTDALIAHHPAAVYFSTTGAAASV